MTETVNLKRSYSALNEKIAQLFDASGVRRSFTVPYIESQPMAEHVNAVHQVVAQSGGLTNNLLTTAHHSTGKGWGSGDGQTVGHPAEKLRTAVIPKNDERAKAVISAAQRHLNNVAKLLGDDNPAIVTANSQLDLVKKQDGAGMNLLDFGVMMIQIMHAPNQAVAKAHSRTKPGGHSPKLRGPGPEIAQEAPAEATGEAQGGNEGNPQSASPVAPAPPVPQAATSAEPPAEG